MLQKNELIINAVRGLGKCLVEGIVTPKIHILDREFLTILKQKIPYRDTMLMYNPRGRDLMIWYSPLSNPFFPDKLDKYKVLINQGDIASQGIGFGKASVVTKEEDLKNFPEGAVPIAKKLFQGLLP